MYLGASKIPKALTLLSMAWPGPCKSVHWKEGILPGSNGTAFWLMDSISQDMWVDSQLDHPRYQQAGKEKTFENSNQYCPRGFSLQLDPRLLGLIHPKVAEHMNPSCVPISLTQTPTSIANILQLIDEDKLGNPQKNTSQQNGEKHMLYAKKNTQHVFVLSPLVCPKIGHPSIQWFATISPFQHNAKHYNKYSIYIKWISIISIHVSSV